MQPRINLWIEKDGDVVLSVWRVQLLEAIEQTGSISAAANKMEISYHRAWDKIQEMENGLGLQLIQTHTGGAGGGGAQLTDAGRNLIAKFYRFQQGFEQQVQQRFDRIFGH